MKAQIEKIINSCDFGNLKQITSVSGGDINAASRVETDQAILFLKVNSASRFPKMFEGEEQGLLLLSNSDFAVPKPKLVGQIKRHQYLIMEWIEKGNPASDFWQQFGRTLANLHQTRDDRFGLDSDNYIGSLRQSNSKHKSWGAFYREERLKPQMELASKAGLLSQKMKLGFDALFNLLEEIYPSEKPSLLHGDLWSGNMMVDSTGSPCIYDPAVYFGHREMDVAMMALFGGFGSAWIDAYNEVSPLESGWGDRVEIGQLYPLMVHVNLFGSSYSRTVEASLKKFI
jgi:protein-ribulosamine 3-kinase